MDPTTTLTSAISNATKVANTPLFTTVIDKVTGFKISEWAAQGELRKKIIQDEYEKVKENGISGVEYIKTLRQTSNLIETAIKSTKYIDQEKENDVKFDNDFFWNTLEYSKIISNEDIQELIAKIIAGEYNVPGTYSMSTLQALKLLGKEELEIFQKLGSLFVNDSQIPHQIFVSQNNLQSIMGETIHFGILQMFQSFGLILPNDMTISYDNPENKNFALKYFDRNLIFEPVNEQSKSVKIPNFFELTKSGKQILKNLNPTFNQEYLDWLKSNYKISGYNFINEEI